MERLFEQGRFSYAAFCQCVQHLPVILSPASDRYISDGVLSNFHDQVSPAFSQVILEYCDRLGWETAQNLSENNYNIITQIKRLSGSRYLLQAVRQHSVHQLGKLVYPQQPREDDYSSRKQQIKLRDGLAAAVIHVAQVTDTESELAEERLALVAELKTFPASSLKYLLPVAQNSQHILCEALGWQEALPLIQVIASIAHRINTSNAGTPDVEVTEVAAFQSALAQSGNALAHEVWTLWRETKVVSNNTVLLIEAIAGWNRAEIEKSLPKRKQLAIKAYGLLPLERGDEVLRYLFFKQFALESRKFGSQRQASEQAAVQTALIYLAQTAGYRDTTRLEWAMEAHLSEEIAPTSRSWSIGEYQVLLSVSGFDIQLTVCRDNKPLKSVPAIVRQRKTYVEIKETVNQLRSQVARFSSSFEEIMATGQPLSCDDLISFSRMPIAQGLLNQLVLYTNSTFGLFVSDAMAHVRPGGIALMALDGTLIPVTDQVYIAHPYHLFHRGELAAWQQEIVHQRLVQPFKQVFRELYLLTPAEQETFTYSNRFAGQTLDSRVVAKANTLYLVRFFPN